MGITRRLLAFLAFSSILLHTATPTCVPQPSTTNPLYPFFDTPVAIKVPKTPKPAAPVQLPPHKPDAPGLLAPHKPDAPGLAAPHLFPQPLPVPIPAPISAILEHIVKGICSHTDNPVICFTTIQTDLPGLRAGAVDASAVLDLQIKACTRHAQEARASSARFSEAPAPKMTVSILQSCTDSYDDALDNLDAAAKAMAARDVGTLNSMLSAALTDFDTCEEGFAETPGIVSPLTHFDDLLSKLASNCLAIADLLKY